MNITIKTIPHNKQRYETVGDWWWDRTNLHIRISDMKNPIYEWLVAEHEINEALRCKKDGVTQKDVDKFDIEYEKRRKKLLSMNLSKKNRERVLSFEAGLDPKAPYRKQHQGATKIEKMSCRFHGEDWKKYDKTVMNL